MFSLRFGKYSVFPWLILFLFPISFGMGQDNEDCISCHEDEELSVIRYGVELSLYVTDEHLLDTPHEDFYCVDCHTDLEDVDDFPHVPRLVLPDCGSCHEEAQEQFVEGFFRPLREKGYTSVPTCSDCHGKHKVTWKGHPQKVCGVCHQDILEEFLRSAHWDGEVKESEVTCVSCHDPHFKHEKGAYTEQEWKLHLVASCNVCHEEEVQNYTDSGHYREVKRGKLTAPVCSDCHAKHRVLSPRNPESQVSVAKLDLVCTRCHAGYEASIHRPSEGDDPRLETCTVCHAGHTTDMTQSESSIFETGLANVCLKCHEEELQTESEEAHFAIHSEKIDLALSGAQVNCGECHQYHFETPTHPALTAIKRSCGECHPEQQEEYEKSSHYIAAAKGHEEAPGCVTCHGTRDVRRPGEAFLGEKVVDLCSSCHANREIILKFQLNPEVVEGYNTSYHGQMYQLGYQGEEFATCVSCHDNHTVLPHTNPEATTHQQNILSTCSQCHEKVNVNFVSFLQHYSPMVKETNPILGYIDKFMRWLLGGTLLVFGGHTFLWFIRLMIRRFTQGPLKKPPKSDRRVRRFSRSSRLMHLGLVISFITLASTGLPLKYSHTEMANWFVNNIVGFKTAALLHRGAATLLGIVLITHILILLYRKIVKREKGLFSGATTLVPNWQDFKDFFSHIAYFIGAKRDSPNFGRWTYWEKFDYFAVFWGMIVIGGSGLTLWFPELFTRFLPGWAINAAHIIHSEEALLATAFIFTVHFFNTHLRPDAFPMDDAIFTGYLTEERFEEERVLEKESLTEEEYNKLLTKPVIGWPRRLISIVAYSFLLIGFVLLVLILVGTFLS